MNLQRHDVINDLSGTTGMANLDTILPGERDPRRLALLRNGRIQASEATIARSLVGIFDYSPSIRCWTEWALPVAPSQPIRAAHIFGLPLAASNLPGIPVRKRLRTSSVSTPMTES